MQPNATSPDAALDTTSVSVAMAVGRQRILDAHFEYVLELIQKTQGQVPAPRALTIYARMHGLSETEIQPLRNRVLVHMGNLSAVEVTELPHTFVAIDGGMEWDVTASLVERIRKRLTGRKLHELREWIDMHAGYVEMALLRLHIENLVSLVDIATETARGEVVRTYVRAMGVPDRLTDTLYSGLQAALFERIDHEASRQNVTVPAESRATPPTRSASPARPAPAVPRLQPDPALRNA